MDKTYAFTDLHGMYPLWEQIRDYCDETDKLIFLGDACDRGDEGLKIIKELLQDKRVIYIKGNHENFLEDIGVEVMEGHYSNIPLWKMNGGFQTLQDFEKLDEMSQLWYIRKMKDLATIVEYTNKKGQKILLSHAGFTPTLEPLENEVEDYYWDRQHFWSDWWPPEEEYKETYIVHGHTPCYYLIKTLHNTLQKYEQERGINPVYYCHGHKIDLDTASFDTGCAVLFDLDELKVAKKFYCKIEGVE